MSLIQAVDNAAGKGPCRGNFDAIWGLGCHILCHSADCHSVPFSIILTFVAGLVFPYLFSVTFCLYFFLLASLLAEIVEQSWWRWFTFVSFNSKNPLNAKRLLELCHATIKRIHQAMTWLYIMVALYESWFQEKVLNLVLALEIGIVEIFFIILMRIFPFNEMMHLLLRSVLTLSINHMMKLNLLCNGSRLSWPYGLKGAKGYE